MSASLDLLYTCAERQKTLFYENFLSRGRVGEILCVQNGHEDTVLFERWEIHGKGFVASTVLLCEDSLTIMGTNARRRPIADFVADRERVNQERFAELHKILEKDGMTIEEARKKAEDAGQYPNPFVYSEITRASIEDRLPPGKKTIQGDRRTEILVLERQSEIPNDLQQSSLNVYHIEIPEFLSDFIQLKEESEILEWVQNNTCRPDESIPVATTLPFIKRVHYVHPVSIS